MEQLGVLLAQPARPPPTSGCADSDPYGTVQYTDAESDPATRNSSAVASMAPQEHSSDLAVRRIGLTMQTLLRLALAIVLFAQVAAWLERGAITHA